MKNYISAALSFVTGLQFMVFGANKFLLFFVPPPPSHPAAQLFMQGMFGSYLAGFTGLIEITGGILLLISRVRFLGLLLLMPVVVNIIIYHFAYDNPGNMIWIELGLLYLGLSYLYKKQFLTLITIR